jgi:2-aminoethylphosphonate-pyruvate transaminase
MTSETVRQAAAAPDLNHRDPEFDRLIREVRDRLMAVYAPLAEGWRPYLLGGSGTAAVEAMVTSCVGEGPVLVLDNGYYSGRIGEILDAHRLPYSTLSFDWEHPIDLNRVEESLRAGRFEAVLMTHHETTLGRLNPVGEVAKLARQAGARCLVDAMSSFGADDLPFVGVDAVASSANKCLHGLPGVSFVLVRDELASVMATREKRSYYLHLPMYEGEKPPLTPPVPTLQAFREALRENAGGQPERREAYGVKIAHLRRGLAARGFSFAVPEAESSLTLVSATLPVGWSFEAWFRANYDRGFVLYGTKAHLRERYFQASVMGEVGVEDLDRWFEAVDSILS